MKKNKNEIDKMVVKDDIDDMDVLLEAIQNIASGHYSTRLPLNEDWSFYNALAVGINMLGEEVEARINDKDNYEEALLNMLEDINEAKEISERTKNALKESEERFRTFFNSSPVGIAIADAKDNHFVQVNPTLCNMLGYNENELLDLDVKTITQSDDLKKELKISNDVISGKEQSFSIQKRLIKKNGDIIWVNLVGAILRGQMGNPQYSIGIVEDITERKNAEEAQYKSEEQYRLLAENVNDVIFTLNSDFEFIYVSPSFERLFGYKSDDLLHMGWQDMLTMESLENAFNILDDNLIDNLSSKADSEASHYVEMEVKKKDGSAIWVEVNQSLLKDNDNNIFGLLGIARDITERKVAEEELKNSEEKLKILFEFAPDAIYLMDFEGKFVDGNRAAEKLIGYSKDEVIGKNMIDLNILPEDQIELALESLANNIDGLPTGPSELDIVSKDGTRIPLEIRTFPVRIGNQNIVLGIARDITERKKWLDELERSFSITRATLESTEEGILVIDNDHNVKIFNQRFIEIWNVPKGIMVYRDHKKIQEFISENIIDKKAFKKIIKKLDKNKAIDISDSLTTKNNRIFEFTSKPQHLGDDIIGRVWSFSDVTKRKRAEDALKRSEEKFRSLVSNLTDVIIEVDSNMNFTYVSPQIEDSFGFKPNELVGTNALDFIHPEDLEDSLSAMEEAITKKQVFKFEFKTTHKDGHYVDVYGTGRIVEEGEDFKLVGLVRDITEQKRMEREINRYTEHLEDEVKQRTNELIQTEKMASLGQLVAGVAHEINNPLGYLNSNTEIIEEYIQEFNNSENKKPPVKEIIELLRTNIKGIDRIATITRSLKRFAVPDRGEKEKADINQGLKDTLLILFNQFKHRIKLHENYGNIPKIKCSIGQLNQVFMNIFLNSSQAMENGDIWVNTWNDEKFVYAEIKDNGKGIPQDKIKNIFDPFFTTKHSGTGLGLSLSYRIINDHNGEIKVDSKEGDGTSMVITLPIE